MKRIFITLVLLCFLGAPFSVMAQDSVSLRTSVRDGFTRVVFDWRGDVKYTVNEGGAQGVEIAFEKAGKPVFNAGDFADLGLRVISEDPLKVVFAVPEGTRVRGFDAKGSVYLDIFAKSSAKAKPAEQPPAVSAKAQPPQEKPAAPIGKRPPAVPPAEVAVVENLGGAMTQAQTEQNQESLNTEADKGQHVVSVTSTSAVDVAVFENFGMMVWAMDQDLFHLTPTIAGPTPEIFGDLTAQSLAEGKAYTGAWPPGFQVKAQGGGLLWRVIFSRDVRADKATPLQRQASPPNSLLWPVKEAGLILDYPDPVTGQIMKVVTVKNAGALSGPAQSYVDFDLLPAVIGMAIRPKVDDLKIEITPEGVVISRPGGLRLSPERMVGLANVAPAQKFVDLKAQQANPQSEGLGRAKPSIFHFGDWKIGSLEQLNQNKNLILSNLNDKEKPKQVEDLMVLAKMHLAHGRGAEALGFLEFALQKMPELEKNPEFLALRGVARAFDWKSEVAFEDLSHPDLKSYDEVKFWRAFVLADLGDWQQAAEILPTDYGYLNEYPELIADRLGIVLAEVNLRAGKVDVAAPLLEMVEKHSGVASQSLQPAVDYLQGELSRQRGKKDETKKIWEALAKGPDDYYRTRAGLALTRLLREDNAIDNKASIDRLERLRYAWRGDELEAQVNYWLGHAYFENKDYTKGLSIMRDAATIAVDTVLGKRIAAEMRETFADIFLKNRLKDVTPLDAVAMYEQFGELTPAGAEGDRLVQILAEHLVRADLLERAAKLLQHQVDHRLQGEEKARIGLRLAALYLMDKQPQRAIRAVAATVKALETFPSEAFRAQHGREITLLSARAYAQAGQGDRALAILKDLPKDNDVSRLRADIAWQAGYWSDAAEALNDVILNENIPLTRPPISAHSDVLMNYAIALNLANDRIALANMRKKYQDIMVQSPRANQFEMITRPRRETELADRETLMSIMSEVDLFKTFLDGYRAEGIAAPEQVQKPEF